MPSARSFLILGASGVLGRALARELGERVAGQTYLRHPIAEGVAFDARSDSVTRLIERLPARPHAALVLLGETRIDACAADPVGTAVVNVAAVDRVVRELIFLGVLPVFVSSDAVFDGDKAFSTEDDRPNPILTYGRQKLLAESHLASLGNSWLVVRLPKLLSPMVEGWIDALGKPGTIECATDQYFTPMLASDAAASLVALIDRGARGLFHLAGPERLSRRELLAAVANEYGRFAVPAASIVERSMRDIERANGLREPRPLDTSMRSVRLGGLKLPPVEAASSAARFLVREQLRAR